MCANLTQLRTDSITDCEVMTIFSYLLFIEILNILEKRSNEREEFSVKFELAFGAI